MTGLQNRLPQKQTNKISAAQQGSEHDNTMEEKRRQPSTGQKRKMNTLEDSNYFSTDKSIPSTNFRACITPFTCTLREICEGLRCLTGTFDIFTLMHYLAYFTYMCS